MAKSKLPQFARVYVAGIALCIACLAQAAAGELEDAPLAERQFQKAMEIRGRRYASLKQLRSAASLLKAAAGVNVVAPGTLPAENALLASNSSQEIYPGVYVANETHTGALIQLFKIYSTEGQGLPYNPRVSYELLKHAASLGDPEAQSELSLILASGLYPPLSGSDPKLRFELGEPQWPEALLHLYFAASGNDSVAQMALGYHHMHGLGVEKKCEAAVLYYQPVAERVVEQAHTPDDFFKVDRLRLSNEPPRGTRVTREQQLLHHQWLADRGNLLHQRIIGRLLSQGGPELAEKALHYLRQAAEAGDPDSMAYLGHMYASGMGVKADNATAMKWFEAGSDLGSRSAQYGLGYMYLMGHGVQQDHGKAKMYFEEAVRAAAHRKPQDIPPEALFHLGMMHLRGWGTPASLQQATGLLASAANSGHILAQYNLAMLKMTNRWECPVALGLLKTIAEFGPWSVILQDASDAFADGVYDLALALYLKAAEAGYELAQANAAWLLTHGYGLPPGQSATAPVAAGEAPNPASAAAMKNYQRAAQQGNEEALLAIGDAHYYGRGTALDWSRAAQVYATAAKFRNPQALFNLGFMHEYGVGMPADLHLAKRHYDLALKARPDAWAPVEAALLSLWLHSWWDYWRPHLPSALDWLWDKAFTLQVPSRPSGPAGSYFPKATLGLNFLDRFFDMSLWDLEGMLPEDAEFWETSLLVGLLGCLWLVVWRRMSLRAARRRAAAGQDPPSGPPPNQMALGPSQQGLQRQAPASGSQPPTQSGNSEHAGSQQPPQEGELGDAGSRQPPQDGESRVAGLQQSLQDGKLEDAGSQQSLEDGELGDGLQPPEQPGEQREMARDLTSGQERRAVHGDGMKAATEGTGDVEGAILRAGEAEVFREEVPESAGRSSLKLRQLIPPDERAEQSTEGLWPFVDPPAQQPDCGSLIDQQVGVQVPGWLDAACLSISAEAKSLSSATCCSMEQPGGSQLRVASSSEDSVEVCTSRQVGSGWLRGQKEMRMTGPKERTADMGNSETVKDSLQAISSSVILISNSQDRHMEMAYSLTSVCCAA